VGVGRGFRQKPDADQPSQHEGSRHSQHRHEEGGEPDVQDVPDGGFQPHFEKEDDHPDSGKDVDVGIRCDPLESLEAQ
jgi:hypothetical protein